MSAAREEFTQAARDWVLDCRWKDDPEDIDEMSDTEILHGVDRHYDGGLAQFAQDGYFDTTWQPEQVTGVDGAVR